MKDSEQKPPLRTSEAEQLPVRLNILGGFVLSDGEGRQYPITTKKNRALLAILALSPGFQATRERLCGLLWGDRGDDQARSSLRQSLAVLRKELKQTEELVLKTHDDIVALRADTVRVDAVEFLAQSNGSEVIPLREAAQLYRGELLNDTSISDAAFEDWLSAERSRLRTAAIKIFDRLIPLEEGHSRIVAAQQLVSFDPLRESSHRFLMQAYADQGDNGLALKQFELCRKLLHEELSVEPARETLELRRQIAEGEGKSTKQENVRTEPAKVFQSEQFPSVAVLPFLNLSGEAQQDYLADGLAEDVIAGLSRFPTLIVISRNSSFRFRGSSTDAKIVGQELGVQYLVAGSLRRVGQLIRISAQLINTVSGVQLWSEKYERKLEELLDVQDDMVHAIVTTFEHRIADIRASEISHQPTSNWAAYDYFLKARQMMSHYSNYAAAEEPLRRAIELDPSFSEAHARLAHAVMSKYWANGDREHIEEAFRHAKTAIRLNDRNSAAHTAMSLVSAFMNNYDLAFLHADRALELNPNNTQAAKNRAMWQVYVGKSAEALAAFDIILMRDPYPTPNSLELKGAALFQLRRYDEAIKVFSMIPELQYWDRAYLVASYVGLGNKPEAKNELSALIAKHPDISISRVLQAENYADEVSREHLRHALLEAGLPEYADIIEAEADQ
jgi:TolB-like protein